MSNPFTMDRWQTNPWKLYLLLAIMWASTWQIVESPSPARVYISISNLVGAAILFLALHVKDRVTSRGIERWAYLPLIWSMSLYLVLALQYEGWMGLVRQQNLGVMLTFAIVLGSIHRVVWLSVRLRFKRRQIHKCDKLQADAKAIVEHYTTD